MDRQPPRATSDEIELYMRTYYSLLRSSGQVRVRAFEEAHVYSRSSLHQGAPSPRPDVAAFAYAAARLPECMPAVTLLILGQSIDQFRSRGFEVGAWSAVRSRGRRRPQRWDGASTMAVFVSSASDIDDLIPIVTAYQVEWNKMHLLLSGARLFAGGGQPTPEALGAALSLDPGDVATLAAALGPRWLEVLPQIEARECDLGVHLLYGSFLEYQRSAGRWWQEIEPHYAGQGQGRPVYFVSSNTHSLANLIGGYARAHRDDIIAFARDRDPEGLAPELAAAVERGDEVAVDNLAYYLLRAYLHEEGGTGERLAQVQAWDAEAGIRSVESPGRVDVNAQIFDLPALIPERLDPRVRLDGVEALASSDAVIVNIDYPLGLAAYHHLTAVAQGVGELRGVYVMGKAATLNGRVGDVMISSVVYDEHSTNSYLYRNSFAASDVQPYMRRNTVLDNQKALTVHSAFLQNRDYMGVFYKEGYTVLEMEAGPYLSAVYELVSPKRHPNDQIVRLETLVGFDLGILHYASDTPYSRRQSLLSKSLSFFGVESTYACAIAILRRIIALELERIAGR